MSYLNGKVVVQPVHNNFLRYRGSVKTGVGDIVADIQLAREGRLEKYRLRLNPFLRSSAWILCNYKGKFLLYK